VLPIAEAMDQLAIDNTVRLPRGPTRSFRAPPSAVSAAVIIALALLSIIAVIAWRAIAAFEESSRWVAHSYSVIAELGQLESGHSRMRLAWRNYLMRPAPDVLDDYKASRQALENGRAHLDTLTVDNPAQHERIIALGDVIRQDIDSTGAAIGQKLSGSLDASAAILQTIGALRDNGERIGTLADAAESAERTLLAEREQSTSGQGARARAWIVAGSVVSLVMLAVAFLALRATEKQVRTLNGQLASYSLRLETTNRELESFSYSVSHDLRAPLRAINGFASMLEEDHGTRLDDEGRRLLGVVRSNADAMARLIDDLLAFSRLGKVSFVAAPVDMAGLVREVLTERGSDANIEIGTLPAAHGDRALLKQVWANLIDNAVKYSANVPAPRIRLSGMVHENGDAEYRIEDNGAGFDMRYYDKLFGVFQRLHSAAEFSGTGVGLAIVQRIVVRHGGRVSGEGRPGAGATFQFTLPAGDAHE
jgi:signal transduction histidine kinase